MRAIVVMTVCWGLAMVGCGSKDAADKYAKKAKSSEAHASLMAMAKGAEAYYSEEHMGGMTVVTQQIPESVPLTPAKSCCEQGGKCAPSPDDWNQPGWQALGFAISDPHYFQYQFEKTADGYVARAVGDLDCDGNAKTFELRGVVEMDELMTSGTVTEN